MRCASLPQRKCEVSSRKEFTKDRMAQLNLKETSPAIGVPEIKLNPAVARTRLTWTTYQGKLSKKRDRDLLRTFISSHASPFLETSQEDRELLKLNRFDHKETIKKRALHFHWRCYISYFENTVLRNLCRFKHHYCMSSASSIKWFSTTKILKHLYSINNQNNCDLESQNGH